jgi:hypothetical protein
MPDTTGTGNCSSEDIEQGGAHPTIPTNQTMPTQHGTTVPATTYFPGSKTKRDRVPAQTKRNTATKKSSVHALEHGNDRPKVGKGR